MTLLGRNGILERHAARGLSPVRRRRRWPPWLAWLAVLPALAAAPATRVYPRLLDPREHPDYERRAVKPPSWETFRNQTQFTCLRGFGVESNRIVGFAAELDTYTRRHRLGDVIWPSYPILFATNLAELADEIQRRGLYLFDIWGYVPGSGPGGYWQQWQPEPGVFRLLETKLGERWLGTDIGEQDGRYIGGYAGQMHPVSAGRREQYLSFQRHFERMGDDLGHRHATLVSLNFGHYFLKEGTYTLIGAETAQGLPNNQVYYAFIRGAGKQYGVPWFGNASIFNRWGYKVYGSSGRNEGYDFGPTKGTSLSLLTRLLYSHILYNCVAVGFENGWLQGDELTPIGRIQQSARRWVEAHGSPGVMHTPVALLLDFYSGWTFPRHLYTSQLHRVWGNLPYGPGDCLTDDLLDLLYPGYRDSSYFRDESGFVAPTPYGDIADCLLSDAPPWLLRRYAAVIVAGELEGGAELKDKLEAYARGGGHLTLDAANLARLPGGLAGVVVRAGAPLGGLDALEWAKGRPAVLLTAPGKERPVGVEVPLGQGKVSVLAPAYGLARGAVEPGRVKGDLEVHLGPLQPLDEDVRECLAATLQAHRLFAVGNPRLAWVLCRRGAGEYTLGILNPGWREEPFKIASECGPLESVRELALDTSAQGAPGHLPETVASAAIGRNTDAMIAGGDVRIFSVRVRETNVEEVAAAPPAHPRGRLLPLRAARSIKEEVLLRPTFFERFDGVAVDWRYLDQREPEALAHEAGWLRRQGLRVLVDLTSGVNLYPGLRLLDNAERDYAASLRTLTNLVGKMEVLGVRDLLLSLHRHPENNFTAEQARAGFERTLRTLAASAAIRKVTVYLRVTPGKPPWSLAEAAELLGRVDAPNLKLAPSLATLLTPSPGPVALPEAVATRVGLWLAAAPRRDAGGRLWDPHAPLASLPAEVPWKPWLALAPNVPVLLDALYSGADEEYRDAKLLP